MTRIQVTKIKSKGLPTNCTVGGSEVLEYTIKVRQWENVSDRPTEGEVPPDALSEEARDQLVAWLRGRDW